jgi:hypothetical protein
LFLYWAIFSMLALGALLNQDQRPGRWRTLLLVFAAIPTALMIGLRWKIGPDWADYLDIFKYTQLFSLDVAIGHQDPGFMVLIWLLHRLGAGFWVLNMICGVIFIAGLTAFCRRQPNPWLAFLVAFPYLVIVVGMSGDRQSAALGFLFFGLNAFERGRLNRFVFFVLLAALFHGSVLLMLPVCLLASTRNRLLQVALLIATAALGFYFFREVFSVYAQRYSMEKIQSTGVAYRLAMNALSAILFLAFKGRFQLDEQQERLWRNISLVTFALGLVLLVVPSSTAVDRFLLYLFPLQFFVLSRIPLTLTTERQNAGQLTMAVIAYAALVQIVFLQFGTFSQYYVPYRSIIQT